MLPENKKKQKKDIPEMTDLPDIFIYGESYVGKSTFIDSLESVLFINTDGNYDMYLNPYVYIGKTVKMQGRLRIEVTAWENFLSVIDELEQNCPYKYVALDLAEDLREHCRVYVCKKLGIDHESDSNYSKAWDVVTTEYNQAIKRIKACGATLVVVSKEVAKEVSEKSGAKYTVFKPNLPDKAANILAGMVKLSCRAYIEPDGTRMLNLDPDPHCFGGGRFNFKVKHIPLSVPKLLEAINTANKS